MIYWFRRKKDDYVFCIGDVFWVGSSTGGSIDQRSERQASQFFYHNAYGLRPDFEYIGRSDGSMFRDAMKDAKKWSKKETEEKLAESIISEGQEGVDLDKEQKDLYQFAWELELENAREKGDKTPPIDVSKMNQTTGNALAEAALQQML